jgi:hypothetical protein
LVPSILPAQKSPPFWVGGLFVTFGSWLAKLIYCDRHEDRPGTECETDADPDMGFGLVVFKKPSNSFPNGVDDSL